MSFVIRELQPEDNCKTIKLGDAQYTPLKTFFLNDAKRLDAEHLAKTFVLVDSEESRICGFATTVCAQLSIQDYEMPEISAGYRYRDYPGVKLARLAVDCRYQRRGLGSKLVDFVLGMTITNIQASAGCRLMFVDSKQNSVSFYERLGFTAALPVNQGSSRPTLTMWLDLMNV